MIIWFASGNAHKKEELSAILGSEWEVKIPADVGLEFDPDETELTFHGNALLKAKALYTLLMQHHPPLFKPGQPIIADDSGICVDALDGRPGIYSARYAGRKKDTSPDFSHEGHEEHEGHGGKKLEAGERNVLLLEEMGDNPLRAARFVCAMAVLYSPDRFFAAQETCEGEIVKSIECARGVKGFGYDPIFYIPELGRTMAELSEAEKNAISHRGKAGKIIIKGLGTGDWGLGSTVTYNNSLSTRSDNKQ
ncbi:MAG: non-canonical purine NTP pyrophosphatase [Treponema sp.]|nr:non-canonical purine NTP pyrophosphatase [Treponema sp.]